jgi:predicted ATPase/DNA-binding winged helix-turn-helix (wHTH) protein
VNPVATAAGRPRFGRFEVIASERQLLVDGAPYPVTPKAFDLLLVLIERAGHLVTKNELLDAVWPRVVVEENNLQVQISALRKVLGPAAIATIPGRGYRFTLAADAAAPQAAAGAVAAPAPAAPPAARSNLPELTSGLIGRDDDIAALMHLLDSHRLVTITGPGGIGKTRLAQAVARARQDRFHDGAAWVELAAVPDAAQIANSIATAVQVQPGTALDPIAGLAQALKPLALLLVIDNAEHVIDVVRQIVHVLLDAAAGITVLLTSQLPLKIAHERVYRLAALELPDAPVGAQQALEFGAVALFAERAAAADRRFQLTDESVPTVIDICRRLDGLALAIELAAARVPLLGLRGVADHIDQSFRLLVSRDRTAPSRQQTLRAAFDWSHELLSVPQQIAFRRLGVFAGSFSLELARAVVADHELDEWTVVDLIGDLIDRSLVAASSGTNPRYYLLETGRAYALEKLAAAGEAQALHARHAAALRQGFEHAFEDYWRLGDAAYRDRYEPDLDNLRAALGWATSHQPSTAVALAGASAQLLLLLSSLVEARNASNATLELIRIDLPEEVAAQFWYARAAIFADRPDKVARTAALRALDLYRELADRRGIYLALFQLAHSYRGSEREAAAALAEMRQLEEPGWPPRLLLCRRAVESVVARAGGRLAEARDLIEQQMQLAVATGADDTVSACLDQLATITLATGDVGGAIAAGQALVARYRSRRNLRRLSIALNALLHATLAGRGPADARPVAAELIEVDRRLGWSYLHRAADALALLAALEGRSSAAARIAGYADAVHAAQTNYRSREAGIETTRVRVWDLLRQALPPAELERQMNDGATLDPEQACQLALAQVGEADPASAPKPAPGSTPS